MRRWILSLSAGAALGQACSGAAQDDGADRQAVVAVLEAYAASAQAGDAHAADTLWSARGSVQIVEGAGVNHGWAEYRDAHLKPELEALENLEYRFSSIEPEVRGDVAWAGFRYVLVADVEGERIDVEGRGTAVLERVDDRWVIGHLHTSGEPRRPAGSS